MRVEGVAVPKPRKSPKKLKPLKRVAMRRCGPRSKKSGKHLFPKNVDEKRRAFIRAQDCLLLGAARWDGKRGWVQHRCFGRVRACHVKSRGAGGIDRGNLYPGCDGAHDEQGRLGIKTFERRWSVNLEFEAAGYELKFEETGGKAAA